MRLIRLSPNRWPEYKKLRLQSLQTDPSAFLGSLEEESSYPDATWQERLESSLLPNNNTMLFAEDDGKIVGMVGILYNKPRKIQHIANIVSFYVDPMWRGQGIGKALIQKALEELAENNVISKISIIVATPQEAAIALYQSFGFEQVGLLKNNILIDGAYYHELIMELNLCRPLKG